MDQDGWCERREPTHEGNWMHRQREDCVGFISDAEHTAACLAAAREHDARSTSTYDPAAAYVAQHRPY